jgi:hypothetical protein
MGEMPRTYRPTFGAIAFDPAPGAALDTLGAIASVVCEVISGGVAIMAFTGKFGFAFES